MARGNRCISAGAGAAGAGWMGTQPRSESRKPARPLSLAPGACGAGILRFGLARLSGFLGRWGAQPPRRPPCLCLLQGGVGWGRREGQRAGEGGTGGRARLFTSFPNSPPWLHPRRPGRRRGSWGRPGLGVPAWQLQRRPACGRGRGGGRAPGCPGARPAQSARGPRGWAWRASAGGPRGAWARRLGCAARGRLGGAVGECGVGAGAPGARRGSGPGGGGRPGTSGAGVGGELRRLRTAGLTWGQRGTEGRTDAELLAVTLKVTEGAPRGVSFAD